MIVKMTDPYAGQLTYFRVYSGTLRSGDTVFNATRGRRERVGRLLRMHANKREDVDEVGCGHIGAAVGLRSVATGDTLCDPAAPVVLEAMHFPEPVISIAIEARAQEDQDRLSQALGRLMLEDPSFRVRTDPETGQTLLSGMGELHLEIICDRLRREFRVEANVGRPRVAYRETILGEATEVGRYVHQRGGRGQFGVVKLKLERAPGVGFEFVDQVTGGRIPREFLRPIQEGVREAMERGVLAGYPVVDVRAVLLDGEYHEVDSSELAFKIAASLAFQACARKAGLQLLEPIMAVEVVAPEESLGGVLGDLQARRGRVTAMARRGPVQVVAADAPLGEMFGYATALRSASQGRATFTMQFSRYAPVPVHIEQKELGRHQASA
jgi:elongation factor G